jgi:hypothetical protein
MRFQWINHRIGEGLVYLHVDVEHGLSSSAVAGEQQQQQQQQMYVVSEPLRCRTYAVHDSQAVTLFAHSAWIPTLAVSEVSQMSQALAAGHCQLRFYTSTDQFVKPDQKVRFNARL